MLSLGDATTIALIWTFAAAVPLLIRFFTNSDEPVSNGPSDFGHDDNQDSLPPDEWPSIIEVTDPEIVPKARLNDEHACAKSYCRM